MTAPQPDTPPAPAGRGATLAYQAPCDRCSTVAWLAAAGPDLLCTTCRDRTRQVVS